MPNPPVKPKPPAGKGKGTFEGVDKKWWLIGGGSAVLVAWYVYHRAAAKSNVGTTDTSAADPGATDTYGYDPYGGSYSSTGSSGTPVYDNSGVGTTVQPQTVTPVTSGVAVDPTSGNTAIPTSLRSWLTQAEAALLQMGYTPDQVSSSLGAVVAGQVTPDQASTIASAAGQVGALPPSAPVPTQAAPAPTTTKAPTMTAPHLTGAATATHTARFSWTAVPGAVRYIVFYAGTPHLTYQAPRTTFESSSHAKGFKYGPVTVRAIGPNGVMGPASNALTITIR